MYNFNQLKCKMAFFHPNIQRFHHHFAIAYCQNMISRVRWESASRYLIVYLEKLFDVCGLFNNFHGMWQLIIYRETNCPVRQGGFFFCFFFFEGKKIARCKSKVPLSASLPGRTTPARPVFSVPSQSRGPFF